MKPLIRYAREQAWPRRRAILLQPHVFAGILVGVVIGCAGSDLQFDALAADKLVTATFAYAALAMGFSLAGLILTLTLPERLFAEFLASPPDKDGEGADGAPAPATEGAAADGTDPADGDPYGDLAFVFSWTALAHWCVIVLALLVLIVFGSEDVSTFGQHDNGGAALIAILVGLLAYALTQFLITVLTIAQVAEVYIAWVRRQEPTNAA